MNIVEFNGQKRSDSVNIWRCLVLTLSTSDIYNLAKKKICGFEWQAEAMIDEQFLDIFLWCNHEVEGNLWRCNARVTIISLGVNGASDAIRKQVTTFHTSNRFMTSTILRNELSMGDILIRLELYDIFGYRDFVMFTIDFTKPSPLTDLNVGFQNSDVRVYVNTQYLSIHSAKFAHLFVRIKPGCAERLCPATENKSESDEAEVKHYSGEEIFGARTNDVDNMCFLLPIWFQFLLHRQKAREIMVALFPPFNASFTFYSNLDKSVGSELLQGKNSGKKNYWKSKRKENRRVLRCGVHGRLHASHERHRG
ncbi:hypothetical protein RB195_009939 [Necator americanus]|uniref:MATH domain-containing protein n=1 Tax=Necator americanus TaxID=51031 RepID=A0ABR1CVL4_NECAM